MESRHPPPCKPRVPAVGGSREAEIRTQRKKLTVFCSGIKDFTASTAMWHPGDVAYLLNSYISEMSRIAHGHGGRLDKSIGGAMVIVFGDPETRGVKNDALQCVRMALAMQQRMAELQAMWREMGSEKRFELRMGINTGTCDIGNFVSGADVNLAARLQQSADAGSILISNDTWSLVKDEVEADELAPLLIKGSAQPILAFVVREEKCAEPAARKVFQWQRLGMRVLVDLDRLPTAEREAAAAQLRETAGT